MFEKLKYFLAALSLVALGGGSVACDDDDAAADEWSSDYVYLGQFEPAIRSMSFDISHSSLGIAGGADIWMPVSVRLSHPRKSDVTVTLTCNVEGGMPAGDVSFREGGTVVIPAGQTVARDTLDVLSDWSFVTKEKAVYNLTVGMGSVKPASGDLRVSSKQNSLTLKVNKAEKADIIAGTPSGSPIADYTDWSVYASSVEDNDVNWGTHLAQLIDGVYNSYNGGSYVWFNKPYLGIKIDMAAVRTVTGLETYAAFGSSYSMSSCTIYSSEDGVEWTLLTPADGIAVTPASRQNISFVVPVTARYFIWHMHGTSCLSSEIWVYEE